MKAGHLHCLFAAAATAALLSACGGGGGSTAAPVAGPVPSPVPSPAPSPAPAPAPAPGHLGYVVNSPEAAVFDYLNSQRSQCGFGAQTQSVKLDGAAAGQSNYETLRWEAGEGTQFVTNMPHRQVAGKTGFTGVTMSDRMFAQDYQPDGTNHEDSVRQAIIDLPVANNERSAALLRTLMGTVYHLGGLLAPNPEIGIGYGVANAAAAPADKMATLVIVNAYQFGQSPIAQTDPVVTYPCEGSKVNGTWSANELPNPLVGATWNWSVPVGSPIYIRARPGSTLVISSAVVGGAMGETLVLNAANDPARRLAANEAFLLIRTPLASGGTFQANFAGTVDGVPFSRTFIFTTN